MIVWQQGHSSTPLEGVILEHRVGQGHFRTLVANSPSSTSISIGWGVGGKGGNRLFQRKGDQPAANLAILGHLA